jgi:hypothetical protein
MNTCLQIGTVVSAVKDRNCKLHLRPICFRGCDSLFFVELSKMKLLAFGQGYVILSIYLSIFLA